MPGITEIDDIPDYEIALHTWQNYPKWRGADAHGLLKAVQRHIKEIQDTLEGKADHGELVFRDVPPRPLIVLFEDRNLASSLLTHALYLRTRRQFTDRTDSHLANPILTLVSRESSLPRFLHHSDTGDYLATRDCSLSTTANESPGQKKRNDVVTVECADNDTIAIIHNGSQALVAS
jgi:hypothetical protein